MVHSLRNDKGLLAKIYSNDLFPYNILKKTGFLFMGLGLASSVYFANDLANTIQNIPAEMYTYANLKGELWNVNKTITSIQELSDYKTNSYFVSYVDSLEQKIKSLNKQITYSENSLEVKKYYTSYNKGFFGIVGSIPLLIGGLMMGLHFKGREKELK